MYALLFFVWYASSSWRALRFLCWRSTSASLSVGAQSQLLQCKAKWECTTSVHLPVRPMYIGPREIGRQYTTPLLQGTICMWCLTLQVPCSVALGAGTCSYCWASCSKFADWQKHCFHVIIAGNILQSMLLIAAARYHESTQLSQFSILSNSFLVQRALFHVFVLPTAMNQHQFAQFSITACCIIYDTAINACLKEPAKCISQLKHHSRLIKS